MQGKYEIFKEKPYPLGCYIDYDKSLVVRTVFGDNDKCGIVLYGHGKELSVEFSKEYKRGDIYSVRIKGIDNIDDFDSYNYFSDESYFCDAYSKHLIGLEIFGKDVPDSDIRAVLNNRSTLRTSENSFDWGEDSFPNIPYEDSFVYLLHVRGFTKSSSSGVQLSHRGTFTGIIDKISYLKELGVTTVELMPAYEMNEIENYSKITNKKISKDQLYSKDGSISNKSLLKPRLNFWGFKKGYYFAPRTAYCSSPQNAENEFKNLIKNLHKNGIEVVMQFFFEDTENESLILDALRYWRCSYHIDGFHLKGARIPINLITREPLFSDAKIWYEWFDYGQIYQGKIPKARYLAEYNDSFLYSTRRFLKSDDNSTNDFLHSMISNGQDHGVINYICNYEGFRLADLVSYEHKHNEENGENNKDGSDNNLSWNCGIEGRTRKRNILQLRSKQIKNILTMLFMAQGTPMIFSGDEFGNSQMGNNNPYCQDNETGWVDWKALEKNKDLFDYVRFLVGFRYGHKIVHQKEPYKLMDYISCGYPDLSCHGKESWRPDLSGHSHLLGMLYCGKYDKTIKDSPFIFIAYNMHWTNIDVALPILPEGYEWNLLSDTGYDLGNNEYLNKSSMNNATEIIYERSVRIYISNIKKSKKRRGKNE